MSGKAQCDSQMPIYCQLYIYLHVETDWSHRLCETMIGPYVLMVKADSQNCCRKIGLKKKDDAEQQEELRRSRGAVSRAICYGQHSTGSWKNTSMSWTFSLTNSAMRIAQK